MKILCNIVCAVILGVGSAWGANPLRMPVSFAITNDAGMGYEWFVVGNHPDVGGWNPAQSIKLVWSANNVWKGTIGVQAGTALEYKFVKRETAANRICDPANATWWPDGANLKIQVPAGDPAPFQGKQIEFYSNMTNVTMHYSTLASADFSTTGSWASVNMNLAGPGLRTNEWRHLATGVGSEGEWIRFTFNGVRNGVNTWEGAWDGQDYWTPLDAFVIRDRQVFNYLPPAGGVSDSRITSHNVASSVEHVTGRVVRVYLPRGYSENLNRSYPVVYMSDGENVFQPGGAFGYWNAETTADAEIKGGRMREAIIVGVPSAKNRQTEYLPHMDNDPDPPTKPVGRANFYADYLIHNVRPTVDYNYRTKNDRANTACIGSSSGGLLATYLGTWTNVFGLVGALSGVYSTNFCPNYMSWLATAKPRSARVWMDVGTVGGEVSMGGLSLYNDNFDLYWHLTGFGYVPNSDLRFMIGCGDNHNELAWAKRLPFVFRFLLDVREEFNPLLTTRLLPSGNPDVLTFPVFNGAAYSVEVATTLTDGAWVTATNWPRETKPWGYRAINLKTLRPDGFFRIMGTD